MAEETIKTIVTDRPDAPVDGTILATPAGKPDVQVLVKSASSQALTRGIRSFIQTFALTFATLMTGAPQAAMMEGFKYFDIPFPTHKALIALITLVVIPLASGLTSFVQNISEFYVKLDKSNPELRA